VGERRARSEAPGFEGREEETATCGRRPTRENCSWAEGEEQSSMEGVSQERVVWKGSHHPRASKAKGGMVGPRVGCIASRKLPKSVLLLQQRERLWPREGREGPEGALWLAMTEGRRL